MKRRLASTARTVVDAVRGHPDTILAAGILGILFVILIPLPPALVDVLLIIDVTASAIVLLTATCVSRPLEFSVFPSLLLVVTFFRLALNIATTRLILGNAAEGPLAAGRVVETFGNFVAGRNPVIGLIIFSVIAVVQFVVITKGSTRVSEVAARFQLDALPGRQLSIDGDLAAGLIDPEGARRRREDVSHQADFYGAMDGASKFVRGDAIAGIVIVLINIVGGIAVGMVYHSMAPGTAVQVFSRLTIGDGLVSQIPALMVSVASALLVTRSAASEDLGRDLARQVFSNERVLLVVAGFLLCLLPSGLPVPILIVGAVACGACAWLLRRERSEKLVRHDGVLPPKPPVPGVRSSGARASRPLRALLRVEPIELEVGYRMLPLLGDEEEGGLLDRIGRLRETIASDLGIIVPGVKVRDSRRLRPTEYALRLRGNALGRWSVVPDGWLVVTRAEVEAPENSPPGVDIDGRETFWIGRDQEDWALEEGLEVLSPVRAISEHLDRVLRARAAELLSREDVSRLLADLRERSPSLVDDLVPKVVKVSELQVVLQDLLREGVSIRDLESILEALGRLGDRSVDADSRRETVRRELDRTVCAPSVGPDGKLHVLLLDPALEEFLVSSLPSEPGKIGLGIDPQTEESIRGRIGESVAELRGSGWRPALLCPPALRRSLWEIVGQEALGLSVLSYDEVAEQRGVEVHGSIRLEGRKRDQNTPNAEVVRPERWTSRSLDSKLRR